jgi:hypothetical protein
MDRKTTSSEMHFIKQLKNLIRCYCFLRDADLHTHARALALSLTHTHKCVFKLLFLRIMNKNLFRTTNRLQLCLMQGSRFILVTARVIENRVTTNIHIRKFALYTTFISSSFASEPIHDSETRVLSELTA